MAHGGPVTARSTSMQNPQGGASAAERGERVRHCRIDGDTLEAAHALAMRQLESLPQDGVLEMEVEFEPPQLAEGLRESCASVVVRKVSRRRWSLIVQSSPERGLLDLTELEAPLPMERILEAVAELRPGQSLTALTPCFPRPLLAQLDRRGLDWEAAEAADSAGLVWVRRPA
jgi:hypothetical protein